MSDWQEEYKRAVLETKKFYDSVAKYYDNFVPPSTREDRIDEIDAFIREQLDGNDLPLRLLELGCGTGSYCYPLAKRGYSVTGIDISPEMNKLAIIKANGRMPKNITFITTDWLSGMEKSVSEYDCVLCIGNSLIHNPNASIPVLIKSMYKALKPGGILVLSSRRIEQELNMPSDKDHSEDNYGSCISGGPVEIPSMGKHNVLRFMFRTFVKEKWPQFVLTYYTYNDYGEESRRFICHRILLRLDDTGILIPLGHEAIETRTYYIFKEDIDKALDKCGFVNIKNPFEGEKKFERNKNWYKCCRKPK